MALSIAVPFFMRILLIEDDPHIGDGLYHGLRKQGFTADWFRDGEQGSAALQNAAFDAVILDLSLPQKDGLLILKEWRQSGHRVPVLILTARDALSDRVTGLNHGADDYLCKPFALDEVIARLHALIRRSQGHATPVLCHGGLRLDSSSKTASLHGAPLTLTQREYLLLEQLLSHPKRIYSRAQLEDQLYGWSQDIDSNAIEVHIHNLRKKIGKDLIRTRRGLGYQLGIAP